MPTLQAQERKVRTRRRIIQNIRLYMPCRPGTRKTAQNHHRMRTSVAVALTDGPVGARIAGVAEGGCHQQANGGCFKIEGGRIAFRTCAMYV